MSLLIDQLISRSIYITKQLIKLNNTYTVLHSQCDATIGIDRYYNMIYYIQNYNLIKLSLGLPKKIIPMSGVPYELSL